MTFGESDMSEENNIIPSGPFKGKKIELAPTTNVDLFVEVGEDFMLRVFGLEPSGYLITDESSLADFIGLEDMDRVGIRNKIQKIYEIDLSDTDSGNLVEIFARIHKAKYGSPS
jgi:hypothetical protein